MELNSFPFLFVEPSGLGFALENQYAVLRTSWAKIDGALSQPAISGNMVFRSYDKYDEFLDFVYKKPIILCYMPFDKWYRLPCEITELGKTEYDHTHNDMLECPITFTGISPWHDLEIVNKVVDPSGVGKTYSYSYAYTYGNETSTADIRIENINVDSPTRLVILGSATNPSWTLRHGDAVVSTGKVNETILEGERLVIDANPLSQEIAVYTSNMEFLRDVYGKSDFSTKRFIVLPQGSSNLSITEDGGGEVEAYLEVSRYGYSF